MVEGTAQAWIDHYGAMAAAANAPAPLPVAGDALPWRTKPVPSRPVEDSELIDLYRETTGATLSSRILRCRDCGGPMAPGATQITDGIDVWHPAGDCSVPLRANVN
jgi:hypothetical protein